MTIDIETIGVGNIVNDGLGDDLRTAFQKVNRSFNKLASELSVTGQNIGTVGVGIFKEKINENLQLKNIAAGDSTIVVIDDPATNTIKITSPLQNAFTSIIAGNAGAVSATGPNGSVSLVAGDNIRISRSGQNITIAADLLSGELLGNLSLNTYTINGIGNIDITGSITANNFTGNVHNIDIRPISTAVFDYDFGKIIQGSYSSVTEFLFAFGDYDFGSITSPNLIDLDLGTI
jgi:voltage-gated potassium channel Kch